MRNGTYYYLFEQANENYKNIQCGIYPAQVQEVFYNQYECILNISLIYWDDNAKSFKGIISKYYFQNDSSRTKSISMLAPVFAFYGINLDKIGFEMSTGVLIDSVNKLKQHIVLMSVTVDSSDGKTFKNVRLKPYSSN